MLDSELANVPEFRSQYYMEALNYLDHFWNGEVLRGVFGELHRIFFKNIFNGCRDYVNMVSSKVTLATSQC